MLITSEHYSLVWYILTCNIVFCQFLSRSLTSVDKYIDVCVDFCEEIINDCGSNANALVSVFWLAKIAEKVKPKKKAIILHNRRIFGNNHVNVLIHVQSTLPSTSTCVELFRFVLEC